MRKNLIICLIGIIPFLLYFKIEQQPEGEKIFVQHCSACHTIGKGKLVGPDLKGITDRRKETWLIPFIKSARTSIKKGDPIALKIYNENNRVVMPDQNLTDQQIKEILTYIKRKSLVQTIPADSNTGISNLKNK